MLLPGFESRNMKLYRTLGSNMSVYLGHQVINTLRAFQGHLCLLRSIALSLSGRIYPQRGRIQRPIQTYKSDYRTARVP